MFHREVCPTLTSFRKGNFNMSGYVWCDMQIIAGQEKNASHYWQDLTSCHNNIKHHQQSCLLHHQIIQDAHQWAISLQWSLHDVQSHLVQLTSCEAEDQLWKQERLLHWALLLSFLLDPVAHFKTCYRYFDMFDIWWWYMMIEIFWNKPNHTCHLVPFSPRLVASCCLRSPEMDLHGKPSLSPLRSTCHPENHPENVPLRI